MNAATEIAQAAAATLFAMPVGSRVKLTLSNASTGSSAKTWEGEITKTSAMGCDLLGKRNASRSIMRNVNTGVGFFIEMKGYRGTSFAVMAAEAI